MALPELIKGQAVRVKVGNGASPEVFTYLCGISGVEIKKERKLKETTVWDCEDVFAIPTIQRVVESEDFEFSMDGKLTEAALSFVEGLNGSVAHNCLIEVYKVDPSVAVIGRRVAYTYSGKFFIASIGMPAKYDEFIDLKLEFKSNGKVTFAVVA